MILNQDGGEARLRFRDRDRAAREPAISADWLAQFLRVPPRAK